MTNKSFTCITEENSEAQFFLRNWRLLKSGYNRGITILFLSQGYTACQMQFDIDQYMNLIPIEIKATGSKTG